MPDLNTVLRETWEQVHGQTMKDDVCKRKILRPEDPTKRQYLTVIYSQNIEKWYLTQAIPQFDANGKQICFLCDPEETGSGLIKTAKSDHMTFLLHPRCSAICHYLILTDEHRPNPKVKDFRFLREFSTQCGSSVFCNMKNSGASFEPHFHAQSIFVENGLPAIKNEITGIAYTNPHLTIRRLDFPIQIMEISTIDRIGQNQVFNTICQIDRPYNPLFYNGVTYVLPRIKSFPNNANFKFGAAEVFGLSFCKTLEEYNATTYDQYLDHLLDVAVESGSSAALDFEAWFIDQLEKVSV